MVFTDPGQSCSTAKRHFNARAPGFTKREDHIGRALFLLVVALAVGLPLTGGTSAGASFMVFEGLSTSITEYWDQQGLAKRLLFLGSAGFFVATCSACAVTCSLQHVRSKSKASKSLAIVPSHSPALRCAPRVAENATCQPLPQLSLTLQRQVPSWLQKGGVPLLLAETAMHAALFLLDHVAHSPARWLGRRVGILIAPYELLPRVLASQRANRTLCCRGGAPPFTVRQPQDWPQLRDCIDHVDWAGGLLLRPTGAVYAVLERPPCGAPGAPAGTAAGAPAGVPAGVWEAAAAEAPGLVALTCDGPAAEDGPGAAMALFHGRAVLRLPALRPAAAPSWPARAQMPGATWAAARCPSGGPQAMPGVAARAYRPAPPQELKLPSPPCRPPPV